MRGDGKTFPFFDHGPKVEDISVIASPGRVMKTYRAGNVSRIQMSSASLSTRIRNLVSGNSSVTSLHSTPPRVLQSLCALIRVFLYIKLNDIINCLLHLFGM